MIAPENAFLVFGSHATKKKMHEVSRERMDLGRYINNLNTVLSDQQQKKKNRLFARSAFEYVF